eukprot:586798-Amphidinium_carterae.1
MSGLGVLWPWHRPSAGIGQKWVCSTLGRSRGARISARGVGVTLVAGLVWGGSTLHMPSAGIGQKFVDQGYFVGGLGGHLGSGGASGKRCLVQGYLSLLCGRFHKPRAGVPGS